MKIASILASFLCFAGIICCAAPLFQDDFSNGLESWNIPKDYTDCFKISSGILNVSSEKQNPAMLCKAASSFKDYEVTVKFGRSGYSAFIIYSHMRYPDYYMAEIDEPGKGTLRVRKHTKSGIQELGSVLYKNVASDLSNLEISFSVNKGLLGVKVSGKLIGEFKDAEPLSSGTFGIGGNYASSFTVKSIIVNPAGLAPAENPKQNAFIYPLKSDAQMRPEIKNGTFWMNGRPVFMLGVNDTSNSWEFGEVNSLPPFEKNDLLTDMLSAEKAARLGFNCVHEYTRPRHVMNDVLDELNFTPEKADLLLGNPYRQHWNERLRHRASLKSLPIVVDYSSLWLDICFNKGVLKRVREAGLPENMVHSGGFLPYTPEEPVAKLIYNTYFREGARYWLNEGKNNPWVYEIVNEVQWYHSLHPVNKLLFSEYLRSKYSNDITKLHKAWGDEYLKSFAQVINSNPSSNKAMFGEWMLFLGDRFNEFFSEAVSSIKEVDAREKTYFDIEISIASLWQPLNGMDYYKLMKKADIFGTEGGVPFGVFEEQKVDWMFEVLNSKRVLTTFNYDLASAFAQGKPVMNQESYVTRNHAELGRVSVKRGDFPALLWFEVFHDVSGSQIYCWWKGGRDFGWKTLEDAKREGRSKNMPPALLNPYLYPMDSLKGMKDFSDEVDKIAELVLPYPRAQKDIMLMYSIPTLWHNPLPVSGAGQVSNYQKHCLAWYEALASLQAPAGVICEQELSEKGAPQAKIIIVPYSKYVFPETLAGLKNYVEQGGTAIVCGSSLDYDYMARPLSAEALLGVRKKGELPQKVSSSLNIGADLKFSSFRDIELVDAETVLSRQDGKPCITQKTIGKGKVFYVAMEDINTQAASALFSFLAQKAAYQIPWKALSASTGKSLPELEIRRIKRENVDIYYFCNWSGRNHEIVNFIPDPAGKATVSYVSDLISFSPFLKDGKSAEWTRADLAKGIKILLPSQEHVIIAVSAKPMAEQGKLPWTPERCSTELQKMQKSLDAELAVYDAELAELRKKQKADYDAARKGYSVDPAKCTFIDISAAVNMGFRDEVAGDGKGGWTDQGKMDLRNFPVGQGVYAGVPFKVIDPEKNGGKSCIILKGAIDIFPATSPDIPVGLKCSSLYFLHSSAWGGRNEKQFDYLIRYDDGSEVRFTITGGAQNSDWYDPKAISDGYIAWEGANPAAPRIGLYCTSWKNLNPEKTIKNIKVVSACAEAVPCIVAICAGL